MWYVDVAEYMGEGYWADYPPMEFETEEAANAYAEAVSTNQQFGSNQKVRRIYKK